MMSRTTNVATVAMALLLLGCGASSSSDTTSTATPATSSSTTAVASTADTSSATAPVTFTAQVWADNWFSLTVNGVKVGEDSVLVTTERSFNAETFTFVATYPLTIAMVAKDYAEDESGLEYIGTDRQQMGDGGLIAEFTDKNTGKVIAVTNTTWKSLVIFRAPLNVDCVSSADPATACEHETILEPETWTSPTFDDSAWVAATEFTAAEVRPQGDYTTLTWSPDAQFIWSGDLKVDNAILYRVTVADR